jgi:hypothetical protein
MATFQCHECSYTNKTRANVKAHFVSNHLNKMLNAGGIIKIPASVKCNVCNKSYSTVQSLKRHMKTCQITFIKDNTNITNITNIVNITNKLPTKSNHKLKNK